eukprot:7270343-Pyramimonas_sp.AAC.2
MSDCTLEASESTKPLASASILDPRRPPAVVTPLCIGCLPTSPLPLSPSRAGGQRVAVNPR